MKKIKFIRIPKLMKAIICLGLAVAIDIAFTSFTDFSNTINFLFGFMMGIGALVLYITWEN